MWLGIFCTMLVPIFICVYILKAACVTGGSKMKEFTPWKGTLYQGQRSSLQYALLKKKKSCRSNPETADHESVYVVLVQYVL